MPIFNYFGTRFLAFSAGILFDLSSAFILFPDDRKRPEKGNGEIFAFALPLLSAFTIFSEERRRLGIVNGEIFAFALPLLSAFTIFAPVFSE